MATNSIYVDKGDGTILSQHTEQSAQAITMLEVLTVHVFDEGVMMY